MNGRRFVFALTLILAGSLARAEEPPSGAEPAYQVVSDWPANPGPIQFGAVSAVATDRSDQVFVFHRGAHPIVVFDRNGNYLRSWGDGLIKKAHGLRVDHENNVWTTDIGDHVVRKFAHDGTLLLTLGRAGQPGAGPDRFNQPTDVAVRPSGDFFVSDGYGNARVVAFSKTGQYLKEWGKKGVRPGEFNLPHAVCLDQSGRLSVGDRENDRVQLFDTEGKFLASWTQGGAPFGLGLAGDGRLFVADGRAHRVTILDSEGKPLSRWGRMGSEPGQFLLPHAVCLDSHGDVYVGEINGKRIQKFTINPPKKGRP